MSHAVILIGAAGRMGREAIRALAESQTYHLIAALTRQQGLGEDAGHLVGLSALGIQLENNVPETLQKCPAQTLVLDLSEGPSAYQHACLALQKRLHIVIGATGLTHQQRDELHQRAIEAHCGILVAPNFSIGALLMMKFAREAAKWFQWSEIIELHHENKKDAPSGTALRTAELMSQATPERHSAHTNAPSRGLLVHGIPIHSVRMPGLLAHQEVILGDPGQNLTLRHDSSDRRSFMPGVLLALERVSQFEGLVYGLEQLLD